MSGQIIFIIFKITGIYFQLRSSCSLVFFQDSKCTLPDVWARHALEMEKKQIRKLPLAFSFCLYFLNLSHHFTQIPSCIPTEKCRAC